MGIGLRTGAVAALWVGIAVAAAEPFPAGLSLAEARQLALRQNVDLRIASTNVAAALGALRSAREFPNPTLSLSTAYINTDGRTNATPLGNSLFDRSYDSIASLSQLIVVAKRGLERHAAEAGLQQASSLRDNARRQLIQAVTVDYAAALAARDEAAALTESARQLRREADIAAHRLNAGDISRADKERIDLAAGQDELGADAQTASARSAVVALETLLGDAGPRGATELTDSLASLGSGAGRVGLSGSADLESLDAAERPDVAAARAAVDQAEANLSLQRRQTVPDVTLSVQYERQPPDSPNTVGVGLSLPLPLWNHFHGEIASARAARDQAEAQLDKVRLQAATEIASARISYREAANRARRYAQELAPSSRQALETVAYAYNHGGAALIDLLDAEQADNQVRVAAVQAQADVASAAITLISALGRLDATATGPLPISP